MKGHNVTFSLPEEIVNALRSQVEKRSLSRFAAEAIGKALVDQQQGLKAAYQAAEKDPDRKEVLKDWVHVDSEGWND